MQGDMCAWCMWWLQLQGMGPGGKPLCTVPSYLDTATRGVTCGGRFSARFQGKAGCNRATSDTHASCCVVSGPEALQLEAPAAFYAGDRVGTGACCMQFRQCSMEVHMHSMGTRGSFCP